MMSDDYQKLPQDVKAAFVAHVQAEMESLRRRAMSEENALAANDQAQTNPMTPGNMPPEMPMDPNAPQQPQPAAPTADVAPTPENPAPMAPQML